MNLNTIVYNFARGSVTFSLVDQDLVNQAIVVELRRFDRSRSETFRFSISNVDIWQTQQAPSFLAEWVAMPCAVDSDERYNFVRLVLLSTETEAQFRLELFNRFLKTLVFVADHAPRK